MSKWEDPFYKKTDNNTQCYCTDDTGLFVRNRQLSAVVAGLLFLFFACFMAGYFCGKRTSVELFTQNQHQDFLNDQIVKNVSDQLEESTIATNDIKSDHVNSSDTTLVVVTENIKNSDIQDNVLSDTIVSSGSDTPVTTTQFYAQLIGFGTEKAAQKFVQKLAFKNITTKVKKRISKTAKGRTVYWYQVVTLPYDDKETLTLLVNRIVKEERLSGVYIGSC